MHAFTAGGKDAQSDRKNMNIGTRIIQQATQPLRSINDSEPESEPVPVTRCRPPPIELICKSTRFSRKEVQVIYRAFKQGCPNGTITLEQFQDIYKQFFPRGSTTKYAEYVFRTFDRDADRVICFEEFVRGLSVISRGTVEEKLDWIFTLYDIDRRGVIGHSELVRIAQSMYDLIGDEAEPAVTYTSILYHASSVVKKMDSNRDGLITREEFIQLCRRDENIARSLELFDTKF